MEPLEHADADPKPIAAEDGHARGWLTRGVAGVGLASFFSDSGHEITTSILPTFIIVTLRSSAGVLGLIEGLSDALTGLAKLITGPLANDQNRRLQMASGGYLVTAAATGAIGLAVTVWQAGLLRAAAWLARGVRSPADATKGLLLVTVGDCCPMHGRSVTRSARCPEARGGGGVVDAPGSRTADGCKVCV